MSVMFQSPAFIAMFFMGIILGGTMLFVIGWAIYHIARGKFREEYHIARPEELEQEKAERKKQ